MKLITFAVPCYNSSAYMEKCVESLLQGGEDVEIILIDDGSTKDNTAQICDDYEDKYPNIIRAIHQENGGHGEGVNQGLKHATGLYYKVVDSDDWVDIDSLHKIIHVIKGMIHNPVDMIISNYVYEHVHTDTQNAVAYTNVFPINQRFGWDEIGSFKPSQNLLMHSVTYHTELLRSTGILLPKHTFYVDNIFVYEPLPYVKTMLYLDTDFYRYFIGRDDQSVNETIMMQRIDQQLRVTRQMLKSHDLLELYKINKPLGRYMIKYFSMMMTISSILLIKIGTKESLAKKKALWRDVLEQDVKLYKMLKYRKLSSLTMIPGKIGRSFSKGIYNIARGLYKFN